MLGKKKLVVGEIVKLHDKNGNTIIGQVLGKQNGNIIINFNHPLAGATLEYDVTILNISG